MAELYEIVDPRPVAAEAPYTYFLPSVERVAAVGVGDLVKLTICSIPRSKKYDAERMWMKVEAADEIWLEGWLDNEPYDMPLLPRGTRIRAQRAHIIDIIFDDPEKDDALRGPPRREYWERCMVDRCILDGVSRVDYVYREEPDLTKEGDKYPDSGWRVRGEPHLISEDGPVKDRIWYIAIGKVLNEDDSWLHLIDEPVGAAFERDHETGLFVRCERSGAD